MSPAPSEGIAKGQLQGHGLRTLHQDLLNLFAQLLHGSLRQIVALLGLLQPLVQASIWPQVGRAGSGYVCRHLGDRNMATAQRLG